VKRARTVAIRYPISLERPLTAVRLEGAVYLNAKITAPWFVQVKCGRIHAAAPIQRSRLGRMQAHMYGKEIGSRWGNA
jgi:hypothetical protein